VPGTFTFTGLEPGTYTVTAASVTALHPVVGTARYDPVVSNPTVVVTAGATASVSVSYVQQPGGTGAMWVANAGHASAVSFFADRLQASTGDAPNTVIFTGGVQGGAVFEADGISGSPRLRVTSWSSTRRANSRQAELLPPPSF
jgi:hypothetical protein